MTPPCLGARRSFEFGPLSATRRKGQIVSLLAIEQGEGTIDLVFSAGIVIRLEVEQILCHVQDLDEPWPTQWRPSHPLED